MTRAPGGRAEGFVPRGLDVLWGATQMDETAVAVLGAGPHGLAAAAHLRRAGAEVRVVGDPMSFWRTMPAGMLLRSNWTATCIAEYDGPLALEGYLAETGAELDRHRVPLEGFVDYGLWVQSKVAPDVDRRRVTVADRVGDGFVLTFDDGERLRCRRLVVAAGIADFVNRPELMTGLPAELVSHTADHRDLGVFAGREVLVVGGGQSALESAALLHEAGATAEVVARSNKLNWLHGGRYARMLGRFSPLLYAPTDVGPMGLSRLVAAPALFRRLPRGAQDRLAHRAIRPAGAAWLVPRLAGVPIGEGVEVTGARQRGDRLEVSLSDGRTRTVDHLLFGTGYRVDIQRYPFLAPGLASQVRTARGYPVLRPGLESVTMPGLHFLGAPAARSFGPIMRFVSGGWYGAASLTRHVTARDRRRAVVPEPGGLDPIGWRA